MIVVDSSALIAILEHESDAATYATVIQRAECLLVSAVNVHETGMVLRVRHDASAVDRMWRFLRDENDFEIVSFDEAQVRAAIVHKVQLLAAIVARVSRCGHETRRFAPAFSMPL